jgi:hypothetical protein
LTRTGGTTLEKGDDKEWVKGWYSQQSAYWGRGNQKVFKSWVQSHKPECLDFCKKFVKLLKARYKGKIPEEVIPKAIGQFEAP